VKTRLLLLFLSAALLVGCSRAAREERQAIEQLRQLAALTFSFAAREARLPHSFDELFAATSADRALLVPPLGSDRGAPGYDLLLPGKPLRDIRNPPEPSSSAHATLPNAASGLLLLPTAMLSPLPTASSISQRSHFYSLQLQRHNEVA
jgi:hypothetical protein